MLNSQERARRKALLVTQAEIDRTRLAVAARDLRWELLPPRAPERGGGPRLLAARLVAIAVPLLGVTRSLRAVRMLSLAVTVYRVIGRLLDRRGLR